MNRRAFTHLALSCAASIPFASRAAEPARGMRIKRIRCYLPPHFNPTFNQSDHIVTVETESGITGIGEGGTKDSLEQCAGMLIGEDSSRIEHLWQLLYRGYFYPPGREKLHALGALDMALWDIRGKTLGVPVSDLLGGMSRDYIECYSTGFPSKGSIPETAKACMEAGFRAYRTAVAGPDAGVFNARHAVRQTVAECEQIRAAVGKDGDWAIDFHTRLDLADAVTLASLLEPLNPYFVEDPLRSENLGVYRDLRGRVRVPIAVGEQLGSRWDSNELIEQHLIDYSRLTLPNVGGITEFMKIAALCETHSVGMVPHFTGPVSRSALVQTLGVFSGPVLMEIAGAGPQPASYLTPGYEFRAGKIWPARRPGLGVDFDPKGTRLIAEVTEHYGPIPLYRRPDGSMTNW